MRFAFGRAALQCFASFLDGSYQGGATPEDELVWREHGHLQTRDVGIPRWAQGIERLIGEGPFVGGARPAVADVKIYVLEKALSGGTYDDIPSTVLAPFARLQAAARGIASHPAVVAWYAPTHGH